MKYELNTFLVLAVTLVVLSQNAKAASTTNGKLLKFYPITREQYNAILMLASQQSVIPEARAIESHRSLANWSDSIHDSWNNLFNYTKPNSNEVIKGYPMCVIKSDDVSVRTKRAARQYAGLAPNVMYTGGHQDYPHYEMPSYGRPPHGGRPPYVDEDDEEEPEEEEEIPEEEEETPPEDTEPESPIVNCVVVVRRKNRPTTTRPTTTTKPPPTDTDPEDEHTKPPHGYPHYPPPYGYPHYPPPGYGAYPPHYYGYPPHMSYTPQSRHNDIQSEYSGMDPAAEAHYQQKLSEYYNQLYQLYMADARTPISRQKDDSVESQYDDDDNEQIQYDETEFDDKDF